MNAPVRGTETVALSPRERLLANLQRRKIPGLDGLRGFAALSVVAFHGWTQRFPGRIAVQMFFVISGLLITWLMLQEERRFGGVNLRGFYIRRACRLLPALLLLLIWEALTDFPHAPKAGLLAALFYYANYHVIRGGELVGIAHTWSLSIEEHFYIVWPTLFIFVRNRRALLLGCFSVAVAEVLWRMVAAERLSYLHAVLATDTSTSGVLLGCGIALLLWYNRSLLPGFILQPLLGVFSLVALLLLAQLSEHPQSLWGVVLALPFAAIVVLQAVAYEWRVLDNPICHFLGQISYGVYLWGFVAVAAVNWFGHSIKHSLFFITAIGLASISYFFVERPVLRLASRWVPSSGTRRATALATVS